MRVLSGSEKHLRRKLEKSSHSLYTGRMKRPVKASDSRRREPTQKRAQVTVDAVLDAAVKLLKRNGVAALTTNRIADMAGVSIGSVYQYFPNKQAIFIALHRRHISQVDDVVERVLKYGDDMALSDIVSALLAAIVQLHHVDPELSNLLHAEVPHGTGGTPTLAVRLYKPLRKMLALRSSELGRTGNLDIRAFFLSNMIESFGHAIVLRRPAGLSLARAKSETSRAIMALMQH
jgi:AcrR family transcriptional regulator